MTIQFGRCSFQGHPVDPGLLAQVESRLTPFGIDGHTGYRDTASDIHYFAFHTTRQSDSEVQPHRSPSNAVFTLDGRLDNRSDLVLELGEGVSDESSDVALAAAAFERWGTDSFSRLVGDWALSIWDARNKTVLLAKDFVGGRHLFYTFDRETVTWCTAIDPLVQLSGSPFAWNEEYVAGWLSHFPATHLTPYVGIYSVSPATFVRLQAARKFITTYWRIDPSQRIRYRTDREYEEHFRVVFAESIRRRLNATRPVLAELSGGMDSSAIVCMADSLLRDKRAAAPRLDTVSYFDDAEPHWNETPYYAEVEKQRGRIGCHINIAEIQHSFAQFDSTSLVAMPGSKSEMAGPLVSSLAERESRVVLSGIGGDEVLGGVPTPFPELADLATRLHLRLFSRQIVAWALAMRKPVIYLAWDLLRHFAPLSLSGESHVPDPPSWFDPSFLRRHRRAFRAYENRWKLFGLLPSFQHNLTLLDALRRQMACSDFPSLPPRETRHPYLDRDLVQFLFAIPREQLVRPGQRRSLMRRALAGIVPDVVLNRKRKAFVARRPILSLTSDARHCSKLVRDMLLASAGVIDGNAFLTALENLPRGLDVSIVPFLRVIAMERWLRHVRDRGAVTLHDLDPLNVALDVRSGSQSLFGVHP